MTGWRRSSRCESGYCVEIARPDGPTYVRDSKLGDDSPVLAFDAGAWSAFVADLRAGRLDRGRPS